MFEIINCFVDGIRVCTYWVQWFLFDCRVIVCACKLYSCFVGGIRVCTYCGRVALSALQTEPTGYMHIERDDLGNSTEVEQSSYQIWGTKGAAGGRLSSDLISTRLKKKERLCMIVRSYIIFFKVRNLKENHLSTSLQ